MYSATIVTIEKNTYRCSALFRYEKNIKKVISLFKFSRELKQAKVCAGLILENINLTFNPDIIVPVPSHPIEEIKRGFSHMNYLSWLISKKLNIPFYPIIGRKLFPIFGRNQKSKDKKQRINSNKKHYIRHDSPDIKGKNILLLDDVMTTGITMNSCADILIQKGASKVHGVSIGLTPL
ncbi:MAG: phosphoribosyltransferase family protein [bacterium]